VLANKVVLEGVGLPSGLAAAVMYVIKLLLRLIAKSNNTGKSRTQICDARPGGSWGGLSAFTSHNVHTRVALNFKKKYVHWTIIYYSVHTVGRRLGPEPKWKLSRLQPEPRLLLELQKQNTLVGWARYLAWDKPRRPHHSVALVPTTVYRGFISKPGGTLGYNIIVVPHLR
jgi:hypothetical protein